ncbi:hypothetical protein Y032_0016g2937 [Ancylostoma ceylanicum]|uniref:Mos1 transposase HTH domain-containing protein n=1 Tax=Ancylostoma ceylanicum TaxID=53326 RepID=A0A016V7R4_9BILA|nr:hypothetical protein Y032_0016g2937 [Ancylostoma ceylanicum]
MVSRRDFRVIMLYEFKLSHSAAEAARNMALVFGTDSRPRHSLKRRSRPGIGYALPRRPEMPLPRTKEDQDGASLETPTNDLDTWTFARTTTDQPHPTQT